MRFQIVNAFSAGQFGGNPAGVVLLPPNSPFPSDEVMRKTAAELRYSETAFVMEEGSGRYAVRYFTPVAEVALCGHATIAAAHTLTALGLARMGDTLCFETRAGRIAVAIAPEHIMMDMAPPQWLGSLEDSRLLEELYGVMGLSVPQPTKDASNPAVPVLPALVSTGLKDIILPVASREDLARISPDFSSLARLSERLDAVGVHAFTAERPGGTAHARNFAPLLGIDEEAATGTGNGALAFYLYTKGLLAAGELLRVVQGEGMGRPSEVLARVSVQGSEVKVQVGGTARAFVSGEIFLP